MTDQQPTTAGPTVFRVPASREQVARGAQTTALVLSIVIGGAFLGLSAWMLSLRTPDVVASLVFGVLGLGLGIGGVATVFRWRRNLQQAVGSDGVVFAVDPGSISLGAFGRVAWSEVSEVVFSDQRLGGGGFQGTPAAYGRVLGENLRKRGGRSEMSVIVTLRDGARPVAVSSAVAEGASGMSSTSNGRTVVRLPFGSALPVEAFHDAYRAVEPVAAAHGIALRYDNKASV